METSTKNKKIKKVKKIRKKKKIIKKIKVKSDNQNEISTKSTTPPTDGVIKFKYNLKKEVSAHTIKHYDDIEFCRRLLYPTKVIGFNREEQLGYGNISKRCHQLEFIITASQTGHLSELIMKHYPHVKSCHPADAIIDAIGSLPPSSESLTHYAIYESRLDITHIIHGHHFRIWQYMIDNNYPSISKDIKYGTLEMANAVKQLVSDKQVHLFVMKGHKDGFFLLTTDTRKASSTIKSLLELID